MATLDQNGFTRDTRPNLFESPPFGAVYRGATKAIYESPKDALPASDARYPAYAAPLEDGRLVTDYRPQCSKNVQAGQQFQTKLWMVRHSDEIMDESRKRQVEWTGASLPTSNTVPPAAAMVYSTPFESDIYPTHLHNGIGVERANAAAPPLFGTFSYEPTMAEIQNNRKNIAVTTRYEGGRNSRRGAF